MNNNTEQPIDVNEAIELENINSIVEFIKLHAFISQFEKIEKSVVTILGIYLFNINKNHSNEKHSFTYDHLKNILLELKDKAFNVFNVIYEEAQKEVGKARLILSIGKLLTNMSTLAEKIHTNKRELLWYHVHLVNSNYDSFVKYFENRDMLNIITKVNTDEKLSTKEANVLNIAILNTFKDIGIIVEPSPEENKEKDNPLQNDGFTLSANMPKRLKELLDDLLNEADNCDCSICKAERKLKKRIAIVKRARELSFEEKAYDYNEVTIALMGKKTLKCCITEIEHNNHIKEYDNGYEVISSEEMLKLIEKEIEYKKKNNL